MSKLWTAISDTKNYEVNRKTGQIRNKAGCIIKGPDQSGTVTLNAKKHNFLHMLWKTFIGQIPKNHDVYLDESSHETIVERLRCRTEIEQSRRIFFEELNQGWKLIASHPHYVVNANGQVMNRKKVELKPFRSKNSLHEHFTFAKKKYYTKDLVWEAFVDEIPEGKLIYKKDENTRPILDNLLCHNLVERRTWMLEKLTAFDKWMPHPVFSNYAANEKGVVVNLLNGNQILGSKTLSGYYKIILDGVDGKLKYRHIFVAECFLNKIIDSKRMEVHHINSVPGDDRPDNLQELTKREHSKVTHLGKKRPKSKTAKKVIRQDLTNGELKVYDSAKIAADQNDGCCRTKIFNAAQKHEEYHNFVWYFELQQDLPNEIWRLCTYNNLNVKVSNLGRVETRQQNKTFGNCRADYHYVTVDSRAYRVHVLVCHCFHGPPPSAKHTVDHIDRNSSNNNESNLRWATKKEQASK